MALGIGVIYQLLFALMIIAVRVQPIIVALSGFLALTGINLVIMKRPGGVAPEWMGSWGLGTTIYSPILLILIIATGGWLLFTLTTFYGNLRLMGYDERAAYTSGVRIGLARTGAHVIAGLFIGLAAICHTALISSGDPTQSQATTMSLTAVTAVVLGGVSLAGGRGGAIGALLGALNLFLIGYVLATFNFGSIQAFVTQLSYGVILILSLLLTLLVPVLGKYLRFISPYAAFVVLGVIVAGIMLQVSGAGMVAPTADAAASSEIVTIGGATTEPNVATPEPVAAAPVADDGTRYLLLPAASAVSVELYALSPIQTAAFGIAALLLLLIATMRMAAVEAVSLRLGVFLYVAGSGLIVLLAARRRQPRRQWRRAMSDVHQSAPERLARADAIVAPARRAQPRAVADRRRHRLRSRLRPGPRCAGGHPLHDHLGRGAVLGTQLRRRDLRAA